MKVAKHLLGNYMTKRNCKKECLYESCNEQKLVQSEPKSCPRNQNSLAAHKIAN